MNPTLEAILRAAWACEGAGGTSLAALDAIRRAVAAASNAQIAAYAHNWSALIALCASRTGRTGLPAEAQNVQCRERRAPTEVRYQAQLQHADRFEINRVIFDLAG
jgi:hypothetical protein